MQGVKYCSYLQDVNNGEPCKHIQSVLGGYFIRSQFDSHFEIARNVCVDERVVDISEMMLTLNSEEDDGFSQTADEPQVLE